MAEKTNGTEHGNIHASRTARHLSSLLQTVQLSAPVRLVLALHKVVVVGLAAVSDKVRRAVQRRRRSTDLLHLGDVIGHRGRVDQHLLVKPGAVISVRKSWSLFNCVAYMYVCMCRIICRGGVVVKGNPWKWPVGGLAGFQRTGALWTPW